jgi:hypothetical protein
VQIRQAGRDRARQHHLQTAADTARTAAKWGVSQVQRGRAGTHVQLDTCAAVQQLGVRYSFLTHSQSTGCCSCSPSLAL